MSLNTPYAPVVANAKGEFVAPTDEERIAELEKVAVSMARKQQELVNALAVAEEKHLALHQDITGLAEDAGKRNRGMRGNSAALVR